MYTTSRRPSRATRSAPSPTGRKAGGGAPESAAAEMQRKLGNRGTMQLMTSQAGAAAPTTSAAGGSGMPEELQAGLEHLSGMDLSDVNVHRNSPEPAKLDALAYAQGDDIHLGPGQETHLPHEAWHVVQQRQGRVQPSMQMGDTAINDDATLEQEASDMGAQAQAAGHDGALPESAADSAPGERSAASASPGPAAGGPAQLMWNGTGNKKITTFAALNTELSTLGLPNVTLAGDFNGATQTAADQFIAGSDMNAYDVQDNLAAAVASHFVPPANCTLQTNSGMQAWVNTNGKGVTPKALKDLIDIANGDTSKIHRSDKMSGAPKQTPYVHDLGSNYVCTFTQLGTNWDGHPIIRVDLDGDVSSGTHRFS
ncbi:MAG: DUF4157 domain-containing protein [Paenibacillaceae bacterium]|nr:DUF4157 domain-containing protein [Paenibacillaceae bacterium]